MEFVWADPQRNEHAFRAAPGLHSITNRKEVGKRERERERGNEREQMTCFIQRCLAEDESGRPVESGDFS